MKFNTAFNKALLEKHSINFQVHYIDETLKFQDCLEYLPRVNSIKFKTLGNYEIDQ